MKIFDVHTHVFPDRIAEAAITHLRAKSHGLPAYSNGTLDDLCLHAVEANYTAWLNAPVATSERQMLSLNEWAAEYNHWPHLSMGGIYPNGNPEVVIDTINRIKSLGLLGIKFHPEYQEFSPSEAKYAPIWEECSRLELPVLFHAGADIAFPETRHSSPKEFAMLAKRFPKLKIVCAHLGGWTNWDEVITDLAGAPVYLDTSFSKPWMKNPELFENIIRKHGTKHILYGSDSPWQDLKTGVREITESALSDAEKEDILWNNSAELFHLNVYENNESVNF